MGQVLSAALAEVNNSMEDVLPSVIREHPSSESQHVLAAFWPAEHACRRGGFAPSSGNVVFGQVRVPLL